MSEDEVQEIFEEYGEDTEEPIERVVADNEDGASAAQETTTVKPKRVIRNPQPKLNAERLKGPRGLAALGSYFERVKFKGKGYEEQDLSVILKTYEYWCHRLFPKYPFGECIDKIEKLGNKKPVITHIKKIRYDMVLEDNAIVNDDEIVEPPDDPFDDLVPTPAATQQPVELSDEVLERIRVNKERAERIRREKLRQEELGNSTNIIGEAISSGSVSHMENCFEELEQLENDLEVSQAPRNTTGHTQLSHEEVNGTKRPVSIIGSDSEEESQPMEDYSEGSQPTTSVSQESPMEDI